MPALEVFAYLQLLDFWTTVLGFKMGAQELSPFIRWLMQFGPVTGLVVSKLTAFALAGLCLWFRRERVIHWANYWYAGLIFWNLGVMLALRL